MRRQTNLLYVVLLVSSQGESNKIRTGGVLGKMRSNAYRSIAVNAGHWPMGDHVARFSIEVDEAAERRERPFHNSS